MSRFDDSDDEDDDGWEETEEEELTRLLSQADTLSPDESIRVKELMIIEAADAEIQDMVTQGKELSGDQQERLRRIMERKVRREAVTKRRAKRSRLRSPPESAPTGVRARAGVNKKSCK